MVRLVQVARCIDPIFHILTPAYPRLLRCAASLETPEIDSNGTRRSHIFLDADHSLATQPVQANSY